MAYNITLEGKNKKIAERMLKSIVKIIEDCEIQYWLEGGTLLGIRRENRLLPWDNDIDISLLSDQSDKLEDLFRALKKYNYRIRSRYFKTSTNYFKKEDLRIIKIREKRCFGLLKGKVCVDIFIKYHSHNQAYWKIGDKTKSVPMKFYKKFKKLTFLGQSYSIPELTDEYLTYRYGNWKTPVKDWNTLRDDKALN